MKKFVLLFVLLSLTFTVSAQVKTPQPSPFAKIEQKVGLTDVSLEYSRPNMRDRVIFGGLVPYNKLWRTGANKNTMITFSDDVKIDGQKVKAGSYAIFTKPGKESWEVVFYSDTNNWGTPREWSDDKVAAKVSTKVYTMPMKIETFTMTFDDLTNNAAVLGMLWENVYVGVKFEVPTAKKVKESMDLVFNGPQANDYYSSAVYYLQEGKNLNKAKTWIDKAIKMRTEASENKITPFWMVRQKSLIHAKLGDTKGAIEAAKQSMKLAKEAGNDDYVALNKKSLKEWGAL